MPAMLANSRPNACLQRATVDPVAQQPEPGTDDDAQRRVLVENAAKVWNLVERRGQIGIPKTDVVGRLVEGRQHAAADRLGLARVAREMDKAKVPGVDRVQSLQHAQGAVGAAVVEKQEFDRRMRCRKFLKPNRIQPVGFVVARYDDNGSRHPNFPVQNR